jgi:hypothetical protein
MIDLFRTAFNVQAVFEKQRWKYCFIGGVAVQKWGQARFTKDIDLTIFSGFGIEEEFIDKLLESFEPRFPNAREFALQNRVLLLTTPEKIEIDVSLGAFAFEQSAIERAKKVPLFRNIRLKLCTAEDLIVYKAFASRPIDWMDIEGILAKQTPAKLDLPYVFQHLQSLVELKEDNEIMPRLKTLIHELENE